MKNYNRQSGQVLLIAVMLMAVLLTIVFSASFVSRTDTQISKLEEESQKTLAAAEAGVEAALKNGSVADFQALTGFTGSATTQNICLSSFITPLIKTGSQYNFYLSTPAVINDVQDFSQLTPSYENRPLTICSSSNNLAMSLALLKYDKATGTYTFKRFIINPPSTSIIHGADVKVGSGDVSGCPINQNFSYAYKLSPDDIGANNLLLFVRLIGTDIGARIGIKDGTLPVPGDLPLQGKTIVSTAKSPTGVSKTIQLFQSYPQIPTEFFVTSW